MFWFPAVQWSAYGTQMKCMLPFGFTNCILFFCNLLLFLLCPAAYLSVWTVRSPQTHSFTTQSLFSYSVSVINVPTSFSLQKRVPRLCFWFSFLCYCLVKSSFVLFIAPWIASAIYYCPIYLTQPPIKPWSLIPALALLEVSSLCSPAYSTPGHFFYISSLYLPRRCGRSLTELLITFSANYRKALMLWIRS